MNRDKKYRVLGLMSGTSLDGLDMALCDFSTSDNKWSFQIKQTTCLEYSEEWIKKIKYAHNLDKTSLNNLDIEYGEHLGSKINTFLRDYKIDEDTMDFVSSHGQTIIHRPDLHQTLQIGNGQAISNVCSLPVVWDFRTQDVLMGGQGAPLVPVGDALLFEKFDQCLNLGGFSNISFEKNGQRLAYDICPVNFVLNSLAQKAKLPYDINGKLASSGQIIPELFDELENLLYYKLDPPKSLGREWVELNVFPLLMFNNYKLVDVMRTFGEHVVSRLSAVLNGKVLVTGGGAKNIWLMNALKRSSSAEIIIPDVEIIDYKEALIFAFLGILKWEKLINVYSSVTGAPADHCAGTISYPK